MAIYRRIVVGVLRLLWRSMESNVRRLVPAGYYSRRQRLHRDYVDDVETWMLVLLCNLAIPLPFAGGWRGCQPTSICWCCLQPRHPPAIRRGMARMSTHVSMLVLFVTSPSLCHSQGDGEDVSPRQYAGAVCNLAIPLPFAGRWRGCQPT